MIYKKGVACNALFEKMENYVKKYDYVIWDFNGTLLDDVMTGIDAVNTLLIERELAPIESVERYRSVFRFPVIEYYKDIGFDFSKESYEELAPKWVALYLENVKSAGLYPDVVESLERLRQEGVGLSVLSASELGMLEDLLKKHGIYGYFEEVMGLDNIHAGSKLALAQDWRARHVGARALFIGDTDHDVDTAKELGADCVLVCRGHQGREFLESFGVPVCNSISEVLNNYVF